MAQRKRQALGKMKGLARATARATVLTAVLALWPATQAGAKDLTLLALGDSLTAGYGLAQGEGFVPQLEAWLRARGAGVKVVNAGVSGDTTAGGAARLAWSLTDEVDLVLVNLGGNDMLRGLPALETRKNLDSILGELSSRNLPSVLIRVPGSLNFGAGEKATYDRAFEELADAYHSTFIPNFFAALTPPGMTAQDRRTAMQTYMQPDGIHPSAEGIALILDGIGPAILAAVQQLDATESVAPW